MNGNITADGVRKDLLWMHKSGIGGFQNFDAALLTPPIVPRRLVYMTPEWKDVFRMTTKLADSLGLEMAVAGSPGWSETGGPWVKPEDAMKKVVWTETRVTGGGVVKMQMAEPYDGEGPFQNIPKPAEGLGTAVPKHQGFYRDIALLAVKLPPEDIPIQNLKPVVHSSSGTFSLEMLTDGDLRKSSKLMPDTTTGSSWIQFAFGKPQEVRAVTIMGGGDKGAFQLRGEMADVRHVEVSDNGTDFRFIAYLPASNVLQQTVNIPATTAKYFRIVFRNQAPFSIMALMGGGADNKPAPIEISEIVLHTINRVDWVEEKAAFAAAMNVNNRITPAGATAIAPTDVIDITGYMKADGSLTWTAPAGDWSILRFGYSLTGKENSPASPEATGLEVDKLDPDAISRYFETYLDMYKDATGGLMGNRGLTYLLTDSWEAGSQNWTPRMREEFRKRRGYDLLQWLPVLTGKIIGSAEESDGFLFDFRTTIGEMIAEYHYDGLTEILAKRGMKRYSESHEDRRVMMADGMEVKRTAAVPMSAMWMPSSMNGGVLTRFVADIRESASVAHIYGQNLVAAESLTAFGLGGFAWAYSPAKLKSTADLELASGLNRFVIHTSVHQPLDDKLPGIGLGMFGQWFNRHDTWSGYAGVWSDYMARSSYMLQQGRYVADVLYYYGQDNNITALFGTRLPDVPEGYQYDFVNADALINKISAKDGDLVTATGMRYKVLVLDSSAHIMTVSVLKKLRDLVNAGVMVTGAVPQRSPSRADKQEEFRMLVNEIWNSGRKNVIPGKTLAGVLASAGVAADFTYRGKADSKLFYVHRQLPEGHIYWVNNRQNRDEDVELSFRVSGLQPELWHPETGQVEKPGYRIADGRTEIKLRMVPEDAVFIVFREKAVSNEVRRPESVTRELGKVEGEWTLTFQKDRGAPEQVKVRELKPWNESNDNGIRYFSGTGTYSTDIHVPAAWMKKNENIILDLGKLSELAEVVVNGKSAGVTWKAPYQVDMGGLLKAGKNRLEIRVTNLWVNRLIGDQQPGVKKSTYTTMPFYQANSPLVESGLMGPVRILTKTK